MQAIWRRISATCAVAAASVAFVPAASAAITPTVTLDQSAGTAAGSTANLGTDLKFAPTGSDSPKDLTLQLPAGLLANAAIDGGACLKSAAPMPACQVGTGTVTASPNTGLPLSVPLSLPVTFDLVAPPKAADLAGLVLLINGSQLGSAADISVRPASAPAGVGINIAFTNIPNSITVFGLPLAISVSELNSTFNGLRLPTSCPSTPARLTVTGDSYSDPTTQKTASAPLNVTGCKGLPFTPAFHVTAARDSTDSGVQIVTDITQRAAPPQATSRTVALALPAAVLSPNVAAVLTGGILCTNPAFAGCKTIGSASATSPLYPKALTGRTFLTGSLTSPAITIQFPAPFSLTLGGTVDLATNTTTFHNLPDIPLADLKVTLSGGPDAAFMTTCAAPSGTATATLTAQNGDQTATPSSMFTVSGCPPGTGGNPGAGAGGGKSTGPTAGKPSTSGGPQIESASFSGLVRGRPTLSFKLVAGRNAPKLSSFTIELPPGLSFAGHRARKRLTVIGAVISGARIKSIALRSGKLVLTLRRPFASVGVKLRATALRESHGIRQKAKHRRLRSLKLTVITRNVNGKRVTLTALVKKLHL